MPSTHCARCPCMTLMLVIYRVVSNHTPRCSHFSSMWHVDPAGFCASRQGLTCAVHLVCRQALGVIPWCRVQRQLVQSRTGKRPHKVGSLRLRSEHVERCDCRAESQHMASQEQARVQDKNPSDSALRPVISFLDDLSWAHARQNFIQEKSKRPRTLDIRLHPRGVAMVVGRAKFSAAVARAHTVRRSVNGSKVHHAPRRVVEASSSTVRYHKHAPT